MPHSDWLILIVMGTVFTILGIGGMLWGVYEEKGYYNSMAGRYDVREFLERSPFRPFLGALKIGGRIALAIGILMLIAGVVLLVRGSVF